MEQPNEVTVRIAAVEDAEALAPLIAALAQEEGAEPPEQQALIGLLHQLIGAGSSIFLIAERAGRCVGSLQIALRWSTWRVARYGYLEDVYLVPELRGRGVGSLLLQVAYEVAERHGCIELQLDVRPENEGARRLYARQGFSQKSDELWRRPLRTAEGRTSNE